MTSHAPYSFHRRARAPTTTRSTRSIMLQRQRSEVRMKGRGPVRNADARRGDGARGRSIGVGSPWEGGFIVARVSGFAVAFRTRFEIAHDLLDAVRVRRGDVEHLA